MPSGTPLSEYLDLALAHPPTTPEARRARWAAERIRAGDWRSAQALALDAKRRHIEIGAMAICRALVPTQRIRESTVRALAKLFDADPDEIAALAGYADVRAAAPDPLDFLHLGTAAFATWLVAALRARHETESHASQMMGLDNSALTQIIKHQAQPQKPTVLRLAAYFRVDRVALLALVHKHPSRVQAAQAAAARQGPGPMRERAAKARRHFPVRSSEERRAAARLGALIRRRDEEQGERARQLEVARAARRERAKERGSWWSTPEVGERISKQFQTIGMTMYERHGRGHFERMGKDSAEKSRKGEWRPCQFAECPWPERLLYVSRAKARRGRGLFHGTCYVRECRSAPRRERGRKWGQLMRIRGLVNRYGDADLRARVDREVRAYLRHLRNPKHEGRPANLLERLSDALEADRLYHVERKTAVAVAKHFGWPTKRDAIGVEQAGTKTWEQISLGAALNGHGVGKRRPAASHE